MAKTNIQSIEPQVADRVNGWLKSYELDYKLQQESTGSEEIDTALKEYASKQGGTGGNIPDCKLLLEDEQQRKWPVLIEYKGYKDCLVKLDKYGDVENRAKGNEPNYKNINKYAVNGAVHYANAVLHYTSYTDIIAIGVTGYIDETGQFRTAIGVYYVSRSNLGIGQEVGNYEDLSFLAKRNFSDFTEKVLTLNLSQAEINRLREQKEGDIDASLVKLHNDIFETYKSLLGEEGGIFLVVASIMASMGVPGQVQPLEKKALASLKEKGNTDGDIILRKIEAFLAAKQIPDYKMDKIAGTIGTMLKNENINIPKDGGESILKRIFCKVFDDLGIYYKIGLTTDFTGRLFNEMFKWLGFKKDVKNDVVLTPPYVATLLVRLARVNKDSYVWDFATGSAGLLVAAMNEMIADAKANVMSPDKLAVKEAEIKACQLLGIEVLQDVYILAVLNMILMGDGSSNILNKDSLQDFDGKYGADTKPFPATAFVLNPPYSAPGKGMIFVKKALDMMSRGYAAFIIQNSAGSGEAREYCVDILKRNKLLASIRMPRDLFRGKSDVQTYVFVLRVGEKHVAADTVRFIDFSDDGYKRTARKKAYVNLFDVDNASERYQEVVNLVLYGKEHLHYLDETCYKEGHIDPKKGDDWNGVWQDRTLPTVEDFKQTVGDFLAWEVAKKFKKMGKEDEKTNFFSFRQKDYDLTDEERKCLVVSHMALFKIGDLFDVHPTKAYSGKRNADLFDENGTTPVVTNSGMNNGITGYSLLPPTERGNMVTYSDTTTSSNIFYQSESFVGYSHVQGLYPYKDNVWNRRPLLYFITVFKKMAQGQYNYDNKFNRALAKRISLPLPVLPDETIDFSWMEKYISAIEKLIIQDKAAHYKRMLDATASVIAEV